MAYSGRYTPKNTDKYRGDPAKIVYRSQWERDLMYHLDHNPNVLEWASEELIIPYTHPIDGKMHRYFPDFYAKMRTKNGEVVRTIIEVKPQKETVEPKKPKRGKSRRYANAVTKYLINEAKWESATAFCQANGLVFKVMTEYDIYGPSGKRHALGHPRHKKKKKA